MVPNPNQLTAELRSMTDAQLQQYAQLHKDDPYILPMALSESNARKMLRMQAQAKQFQPQPTERDKALMTMQANAAPLPEDVGIAALPAQNLEGMADGGIVGYADGGGMMDGGYNLPVGYEPNRTPLLSYADGGYVERYADEGLVADPLGAGLSEMYSASETAEPYTGRGLLERLVLKAEEPEWKKEERLRAARDARAKDEKKSSQKGGRSTAKADERLLGETPPEATAGYEAERARNMAMIAGARAAAPTPEARPTAGPAAAAPAGIAALTPMQRAEQYLPSQDQAMREYETRETKAADEQLARLRAAMTEDKSKAYEGLESRIKAQESAAAGKLSEEKAMAIFQAGLAIMGGTSPHAAANIGAGALKGLEGYKDAKKELDKAAREREKMLADIEQARRAESRDDRKMMMTFMERADDRKEKIRDSVFAAGQSLGIKKGEMAAGFEKLEIQQAGEDRRARMQAAAMNRTPAEIQLIERVAAEKKIPFSQAMEVVAGLKREPMTREKAMQAWMQPGAAAMIQAQYPNIKTFDDYWNAMSGSAGGARGAGLSADDQALINKYSR